MCFSSSNFVSGLFLFLNMKYEQSFYFDKKDKEKNSVSSTRLMCHKVCIQAKESRLLELGIDLYVIVWQLLGSFHVIIYLFLYMECNLKEPYKSVNLFPFLYQLGLEEILKNAVHVQ